VSAYGAIRRPSRSIKRPREERFNRSNPGESTRERQQGAKRRGRSNPQQARRTSIESGAIRERCKALSVEQGAIRCTTRTQEIGSGAICNRRRASSVDCRVKSVASTGWTKRNAEQSARGGESQVSSEEQSTTGAHRKVRGPSLNRMHSSNGCEVTVEANTL